MSMKSLDWACSFAAQKHKNYINRRQIFPGVQWWWSDPLILLPCSSKLLALYQSTPNFSRSSMVVVWSTDVAPLLLKMSCNISIDAKLHPEYNYLAPIHWVCSLDAKIISIEAKCYRKVIEVHWFCPFLLEMFPSMKKKAYPGSGRRYAPTLLVAEIKNT